MIPMEVRLRPQEDYKELFTVATDSAKCTDEVIGVMSDRKLLFIKERLANQGNAYYMDREFYSIDGAEFHIYLERAKANGKLQEAIKNGCTTLEEVEQYEKDTVEQYRYIVLREMPQIKEQAAEWFHSKWGVPKEAYLACMEAFLRGESEYGWYLCLFGDKIVGGLGVIENDFHDRKDLAPDVCAVYTEEAYRSRGIAGKLLNMVVEDCRQKGISPLYLITNHTGFYERYGWEFYCMVQGDGEPEMSRMYIHR